MLRARDLLALPDAPDYPDLPDWRNSRIGTIAKWKGFADYYGIYTWRDDDARSASADARRFTCRGRLAIDAGNRQVDRQIREAPTSPAKTYTAVR